MDNHLFVGHVAALGEVRGDALVDATSILGPLRLGEGQKLIGLHGTWPGQAYAVIETYDSCFGGSTSWALRRWNRDRWLSVQGGGLPDATSLAVTSGGSVVTFSGEALERTVVGSDTGALVFEWAGKPVTQLEGSYSSDKQIVATGDGGLHVLGEFKAGAEATSRFQVADSAGPRGRLVAKTSPCAEDPKAPFGGWTLVRGTNGGAYLFGTRRVDKVTTAVLAKYETGAWQCEELSQFEGIGDLAVSSAGTVAMIVARKKDSAIVQRSGSGQWEEMPMPDPATSGLPSNVELTPLELAFASDEGLWVVAGPTDGNARVVLHNRPVAKPYEFPALDAAQLELAEYDPPKAATPECETLFAMLYTLAKTAPADYDFPLTREALKGHMEFAGTRFLEARSLGKRYFGAIPTSFEKGKRLVEFVKKGVVGSSPVLLCRTPLHVTRDVAFDLKTGKVLPPSPPATAP